jgi:hypothetical protein
MFLYLEKSSQKVICSPEGLTRPEVQKVYSADKTKTKDQFNAVITGLYWIYKPRGIYANKSLTDRIKIVNEDYLTVPWDHLSKLPGVKQLIDCYVNLTSTLNDQAFDNLRNDFEALMQALNEVPTKVEIEIPADVEVLCDDGEIHKVKKSAHLLIPTFDKKSELWDMYQKFSKILKTIQADLKLEEEERAKSGAEVYPYDGEDKKITP